MLYLAIGIVIGTFIPMPYQTTIRSVIGSLANRAKGLVAGITPE